MSGEPIPLLPGDPLQRVRIVAVFDGVPQLLIGQALLFHLNGQLLSLTLGRLDLPPQIQKGSGHIDQKHCDHQLCQQTGAFQTQWTLPLSPGPRDGGPWTPFLELSDLFYTISQQKGRYFLQVF